MSAQDYLQNALEPVITPLGPGRPLASHYILSDDAFMPNELKKPETETPSIEIATKKGGIGNLLRAIGEDSPELLTGALGIAAGAAYGPIEGIAAVLGVKVLHGALKGQGLKQIAAALQPLKDAGKIKEDFEESDLGKACLAELLDAIEKNPDPNRIQALKNAFVRIATNPGTNAEAIRQQQILHAIGALSSGDIVLLATMYRVGNQEKVPGNNYSAPEWVSDMAKETGFVDRELVEAIEAPLVEKQLVTPRLYADKSGIRWGRRNRLTDFGNTICEFMQEP